MKFARSTALLVLSISILLSMISCNKLEHYADQEQEISQIESDKIDEIVEIQDTQNDENEAIENDESNIDTIIEEPIPVIEEPVNPFQYETAEAFFENAAFVGDSVMYGLEIYSRRKKTVQSNATFLTLSSFAARHALSEVTENSYHPTYNGEKMRVEDALVLDGANKVFLFLGLNDVRVTPTEYYDNYVRFIDCIKEKNPDINIFIISTTYPIESPHSMSKTTAASYRDQLKDLNEHLYNYCSLNNAYYIDVITPLMNDKGFLDDSYTSDRYVHLTNSAYEIWTKILDEYANALITTGLPPVIAEDLPDDTEYIPDDLTENAEEAILTESTEIVEEIVLPQATHTITTTEEVLQ